MAVSSSGRIAELILVGAVYETGASVLRENVVPGLVRYTACRKVIPFDLMGIALAVTAG